MNKMTTKTNNLSTVLSGATGVYCVASELSKRGYIASITIRNAKGVDIFCSNSDSTKVVGIQVKANQYPQSEWIVNNYETIKPTRNLFFIFVKLNLDKPSPDYYIVPSEKAVETIKKNYDEWMNKLKRDGTPKKGGMAKFFDLESKYKDQWNLLGL